MKSGSRAGWWLTLALMAALAPIGARAAGGPANDPLDPSPFGVNFLKWEFLKGHADALANLAAADGLDEGGGDHLGPGRH